MRRSAIKIWFGVLASLLAFVAVPAGAQVQVDNPPDPWTHAGTGTQFPAALSGFQRRQVFEYSEDGRDAGVNYFQRRGDDWANVSVYVYPAISGSNCQAVYEEAKADVTGYAGARLVGERMDPPPAGRGAPAAYHARYQLPAGSMRADLPELRSEVYLYCPTGNQWLVKYRATWTLGTDFAPDVETLIRSFEWPGSLGG